jgi:putative sterol carrier protein
MQDREDRFSVAIAHAAGVPSLADFTSRWPNLLQGKKTDPTRTLEEIGKRLSRSKRSALIRITLGGDAEGSSWSLSMKSGRCSVSRAATGKANLELITTPATWTAIVSGSMSPLEAFGRGQVRVRGDIELARLLARRIQEG